MIIELAIVLYLHGNLVSCLKPPFVSSINPNFPNFVQKSHFHFRRGGPLNGRYSLVMVNISFIGCTNRYTWNNNEKIIIQSNDKPPSIFIVLERSGGIDSVDCSIVSYVKVWYNLNGYPLMVIYQRNNGQILERSYGIMFHLADLLLDIDKLIYSVADRIVVRCALVAPPFIVGTHRLKIVSADPHVQILKHRLTNGNRVLELTGQLTPQVIILNFTCSFGPISTSRIATLRDSIDWRTARPISIVNHSALGVSLSLFLIAAIIIGIYLFIVGLGRKLTDDVTAFHTEVVEDRSIRFIDPIVNNLTSPARKYSLPGIIDAYRLRRNFHRLMLRLLQYRAHVDKPIDGGPTPTVDKAWIERAMLPLLTTSLGDRVVVGLGPRPEKREARRATTELADTSVLLSTDTKSSEASLRCGIDSQTSLDPHTIGSLPYVRVTQGPVTPYWSIKDTGVLVRSSVYPLELKE